MLYSVHRSRCLSFLMINLIVLVNCDNSSKSFNHHENRLFIERQTELITSGFSVVLWNHIRNYNSSVTIPNVSGQCSSYLTKLIQSTLNGQVWALKFISYSGSKPNDFLDGSYTAFGSYDSCLGTREFIASGNQSDYGYQQLIEGKYCLTSLEPDLLRDDQSEVSFMRRLFSHHFDSAFNLTIKVGVCIPSVCSSNDLKQLMSSALTDYNWRLIDVNQCEVETTFFQRYSETSNGQKVFFWLFMTLIVTVVWGTLLDLQSKSSSDEVRTRSSHIFWVQQFSVFKSTRSLFRKPENCPKIILLDQLRFTCLIIVLGIHSIMWYSVVNAGFMVENTQKGLELYKEIFMQPAANDWITEGLIVVGGLSAATTLIKKVTPQTPVSTYLRIIIRRAALLVPALMTVISIEVILPLFGSGPIFKSIAEFRSNACLKNFIYNILHVQNFNEPLEICASHTWTIAVEWQLFILLCVAIYIYKRSYRIGLAFNLFMILFGIQRSNQVMVKNNIIPHVIMISARFRDIADRMGAYYVATETHIWSYFYGLLLIILMLGNYESKLEIILKQLRYKVMIALTLVLSYTSAPWNVFGMPIEPVTTLISSLVLKLLMASWCAVLVLAHGKRFRRFLAHSKSNDIYIHKDENELKVDSNGPDSSANNNNLNNNQESTTINQPKDWSPAKLKAIHRFEVILRFFKSGYFIHSIVFAFYFTTLRNPLPYSLRSYLTHLFVMPILALAGGFIFYLLIIGPVERIQYLMSKKGVKSKTN